MTYYNHENSSFNALLGQEFDFFGVCNHEFKLGKVVWEALEDPDDGYRSYLGSIERKASDGIFFNSALARVKLVRETSKWTDEYKLIDAEDGHEWLSFGTNECDDYYPYFVFSYAPKKS